MTTEDPPLTQRDTPDSEAAPSLILKSITIPEPIPLTFNDTQDDTLKANIANFNQKLTIVHALWSTCNSFGKALSLLSQIDKLIIQRCEIMGHPYGASSRSNAKGDIVYPND